MPYAIFYQGNVAIHYSQDFSDKGYDSGSHGCSQMRDYQALVGDKIDNVPGVPGIGQKTAVTLLERFGTLEGVLDRKSVV